MNDKQIKWLCTIFPISALMGPIGIVFNIIIYALLLVLLLRVFSI